MNVWRVILATLVIFVAGALGGAATVKLLQGRPNNQRPAAGPPWAAQRSEMLRRMHRELDLTREQREEVRRVIEESRDRMNRDWRKENQIVREELGRILTPEQRRRWQEIQKNRPSRRPEIQDYDGARKPDGRRLREPPLPAPETNLPPPPQAPRRESR